MMQNWESYNQIYMATDLQKVPWSPHNMFADMYVARAPWHVVFCWLMGGTGGGGVGAEEGEMDRGEAGFASLNPTLGSNP